jgi:signal transduction histidine kinase
MELATTNNLTHEHDIVPPHLAVQAMRDNGYKNAAYALAELIDNAIQAEATVVELLCAERREVVRKRERSRVDQIAVLDNGNGMGADVLRMALQFGNGTHLTPEEQEGIGKFGMGLPSSSISQCERVDVWSWTDGAENALHSYIDLRKIKDRTMRRVPEPEPRPIPALWHEVGETFGESGTLVVWSRLDRILWKTARAIIRNSEFLIGSLYRKFLVGDEAHPPARIRMAAFDVDDPSRTTIDETARPNDPGYLMAGTSCPEPFSDRPMFEVYGTPIEREVPWDDEAHTVRVTFSMATEEARRQPTAGSLPHGKHAANNVGVSVVRAGRELELNNTWTIQYDPRERWWGVEVDFPPALDDLFGVSNNKQSARNFHQIDYDDLREPGETDTQMLDRLREEEHPLEPILRLSHDIETRLRVIRGLIQAQKVGERERRRRHQGDDRPEQIATGKTKELQEEEGQVGESDQQESEAPENRVKEIQEELVRTGSTEEAAEEIAVKTVHEGLKYAFHPADMEGEAFFSVRPKGGSMIVHLNMNHPAYSKLVELLEEETGDASSDELKDRLRRARDGLRLLFFAWARYEDTQQAKVKREWAQMTRTDWGRIARRFLDYEE